jgi:hypothetical protein
MDMSRPSIFLSEYVLKLGDRDTRPQVLRNWGFHIGTSFRNLYEVPTANQKCQRKNIGDLRKIKVQITVKDWHNKGQLEQKKEGLSVDRTRDLKICNLTLYH